MEVVGNGATAQENTQVVVATAETNAIVKSVVKKPLTVSRVYKSDWQKEGSLTAEIKQVQTTTTKYPSKRIDNNMQDNIFGNDDFGYETKDFENDRTLVAWIDVPENSTIESVVEKLKSFPKASIYRVISNHPILHSGQASQINRLISEGKSEEAIKLKDDIANRQVIIYGADTEDGHKAGELILDSYGKPQFKADYFSKTEREDIDDKNNNPESFYITPLIKSKLAELGVEQHEDQQIK